MFTNQYINILKTVFAATAYSDRLSIKDYFGNSRTIYPVYKIGFAGIGACMQRGLCADVSASKETSIFDGGIFFGSGSTPATKSDYCLESLISSGLTITKSTLASTTDGKGKYAYSMDFIVKNTTESEVNIYEMGAVTMLPGSSNNSLNTAVPCYPILLERTVLTEPITIAPGESKLVTYKVTFNQTLNVE